MLLRELAGKNICILGYGREGRATAEALEKYAPGCEITIADENVSIDIPERYWRQVGTGWLANMEKFDIIITSPGIHPRKLFSSINDQVLMITPTQLFFSEAASRGGMIIGVTGSKGKSTTSSLITHILKTAKERGQLGQQDVLFVGNIGVPAISSLESIKPNTIIVHELSSAQLSALTVSPHIAVITSLFPEHMDYHGSLEAYYEAKSSIVRHQNNNDIVIFPKASADCMKMAALSVGTKIGTTIQDAPIEISDTNLKGGHNLGNIALAWKACEVLGVPRGIAIEAIKTFQPLPHRLQSLGIHDGIEWVNDSISTTPESTIAALDALGDRVQTIILGGQDRGYNFSPLIERLKTSSIKTAILLPASGNTIGAAIVQAKLPITCIDVATMEEAVRQARLKSPLSPSLLTKPTARLKETPIVLLSPAAPSYGFFRNFEERGSIYAMYIQGREKMI